MRAGCWRPRCSLPLPAVAETKAKRSANRTALAPVRVQPCTQSWGVGFNFAWRDANSKALKQCGPAMRVVHKFRNGLRALADDQSHAAVPARRARSGGETCGVAMIEQAGELQPGSLACTK